MQRSIAPGNALFLGKLFQAAQVLLGELTRGFLIGRIAVVNPAGKGPGLPSSTQVLFLKWAEIGADRLSVMWSVIEEGGRFEVAHEQNVAVLFETATTAAGNATGTGLGDVRVCLSVKIEDLPAQSERYFVLFYRIGIMHHGVFHMRMTLRRWVISSAEISSPCPEPGQTWQV